MSVIWANEPPTNRRSVERGHERYEHETTAGLLLVAAWKRANRKPWFQCAWPLVGGFLLACLWCGAPIVIRALGKGW